MSAVLHATSLPPVSPRKYESKSQASPRAAKLAADSTLRLPAVTPRAQGKSAQIVLTDEDQERLARQESMLAMGSALMAQRKDSMAAVMNDFGRRVSIATSVVSVSHVPPDYFFEKLPLREPVRSLLHLGADVSDRVEGGTINHDDFARLGGENTLHPRPGMPVFVPNATSMPMVWTAMDVPDGVWATGNGLTDFVKYWAIAIFAPYAQDCSLRLRYSHSVKVWLDGSLLAFFDDWDGGQEQMVKPFPISAGWHQFIFKLRDGPHGSYLCLQFDDFKSLYWSYGIPPEVHKPRLLEGEWARGLLHLGAAISDRVDGGNISTDYLTVLGGERTARPQPWQTLHVPGGTCTPMMWTPIWLGERDAALNSTAVPFWNTGRVQSCVQYWALALFSPVDQDIRVVVQQTDSFRGWIDGQLCVQLDEWAEDTDQSLPPVHLSRGWHQCMFKLRTDTGGGSFAVRFEPSAANLFWSYSIPPDNADPTLKEEKTTGFPVIEDEWLTHFLHFGRGLEDHLKVPEKDAIRTDFLTDSGGECGVWPKPFEGIKVSASKTESPLMKWIEMDQPSGRWGVTIKPHPEFATVQYCALAIHSPTDQMVAFTVIYKEELRVWLDGSCVVKARKGDGETEVRLKAILIGVGWHQLLFKIKGAADGRSQFALKFEGKDLVWRYQCPHRVA
eukprot:TRINITY_DN12060_c0_g1_i1.p1 TRINITY_DN12060_c0_g1~~TRINITY_DN12060_c0_g1_i1.p1  ORF type:complete len:672 (+),score=74.76 TRINITY_DN12060_c0_g1_i1:37-2052(+)